jgi:hypothetical protein
LLIIHATIAQGIKAVITINTTGSNAIAANAIDASFKYLSTPTRCNTQAYLSLSYSATSLLMP